MSEQTGEEVQNDQIVKGYEVAPGQYVVVDDDELKALARRRAAPIQIEDFVDLDQIDPIYFEQPYYLARTRTLKPYRLLVDAMTELEQGGDRPRRDALEGEPRRDPPGRRRAVHGDDALRRRGARRRGRRARHGDDAAPNERELEMAKQLVETLSAEFDPEKYHDEYREELLSLIERKAAGEEIVAQPQRRGAGKVVDLMAALEASLERAGVGTDEGAAKPKRGARKSA